MTDGLKEVRELLNAGPSDVENLCGRCKRIFVGKKPLAMCPDCLIEATDNYRLSSRFFFGLAIMAGSIGLAVITSDYSRTGMAGAAATFAITGGMALLCGLVGVGLRYAARSLK